MGLNSAFLAVVVALLACGAAVAAPVPMTVPADAQAQAQCELSLLRYPFVFPRESSQHFGMMVETAWWLGNLWTDDGRRMGFQATTFRTGCGKLVPINYTSTVVFLDASLPGGGGACYSELVGPASSVNASAASGGDDVPLVLQTPIYSIQQTDRAGLQFALNGVVRGCAIGSPQPQDVVFNLTLSQADFTTGVLLAGHRGFYRNQGQAWGTYEYDNPALKTQGTLQYQGKKVAVTGNTWLQHLWFAIPTLPSGVKWSWFAFTMDNGYSLLFSAFWTDNVQNFTVLPHSFGNVQYQAANGSVINQQIFTEDVSIQRWDPCVSNVTGITYWCQHRFSIPSLQFEISIKAMVRNAEVLWEDKGPGSLMGVNDAPNDIVAGSVGGAPMSGSGWVETFGFQWPSSSSLLHL